MIRCYRCGKEKEPCLFPPSSLPERAQYHSEVVCRKCEAQAYGQRFGDQVRLGARIAGQKLVRFEKAKSASMLAKRQAEREEIKRLKALREERLKKMAEQE